MKNMKFTLAVMAVVLLWVVGCSTDDGPEMAPAAFSVDKKTIDFGEVEIGSLKNVKITITNTGEDDLVLKDYSLSSDDTSGFSVNFSESEVILPADGIFEMDVNFIPTVEGEKTSVLTIVSNIGENKINLKGEGVPVPVAVFGIDIDEKDFGDVDTGGEVAQVFTVTNQGTADLHLMSYSVEGDAGSFQTDFTAQTMAPGAFYELEVIFMPQSKGAKSAVITLTTNVGDHTIGLQGNGVVNEPVVTIPDTNFKAVLLAHGSTIAGTNISKIDTNDDGEIQVSEAESYTGTISSSQRGVNDLSGIEAFINITELRCDNNPLTQLDLSINSSLRTIIAYRCELTSIDISNSPALETLHLDDNKLSNLSVQGNTNLKILRVQRNGLTTLDLSQNTALETLLVDDNALSVLDVSNSPNLISLMAQRNELTNIDITQNSALETLYLDNNQLSSLNVSNNPNLKLLWVQLNALTSLDITTNSKLEEIRCGLNQLSSMDLTQNLDLKLFYSDVNKLTTLDVSKNVALTSISIADNLLTSLSLKQNPALEYVSCPRNKLTNLDVSSNGSLQRLICESNQLKVLILNNGNNTGINYMGAKNNPDLTCIQIDEGFEPPTDGSWNKDDSTSYSTSCP